MKTISISKEIWKDLRKIRNEKGFKNDGQTIEYLYDTHVDISVEEFLKSFEDRLYNRT